MLISKFGFKKKSRQKYKVFDMLGRGQMITILNK